MDFVPEFVNAGLVKSATTLLNRVCWKTETGQYWVVLGPNGAGKASLMRAASGRPPLNRGNATLGSQNPRRIDPAELVTRAALVSKSSTPSIRNDQRVLDPVRIIARGTSVHRGEEYEAGDEACCQNLLEVFGISHLTQREFRTLSEGEAQRVLLARSLMLDPEVLILDRPGADLDLRARELFLSALEKIMSGMRAPQVVLVTHQMEDIPAGITHAAIIVKGHIIAQGPIDGTLTGVNPSHAYELPLSVGCDASRWWVRGLKRS